MVLGAAAGGLMSLGLALPTGWMFGYGYGHGVRSGYNAYKPSKNQAVNDLHLSSNPVQGAQGAGLLSAEHMIQQQMEKSPLGLTNDPSITAMSEQVENVTPAPPQMQEKFYDSKDGTLSLPKSAIYSRAHAHGIDDKRYAFKLFVNRQYPFNRTYKTNIRRR